MEHLPPGRMKKTDKIVGADSPIPDEPGIYRHIDKITNCIIYIGQSLNVRTRQQQHARAGKLDPAKHWVVYTTLKELSKQALRIIETTHIKRHNPPGNSCRGGNGR